MNSLLETVRNGRTAETVTLLDGMTDAERRALVPELKALRSELRSAPWNAASRRAWPTLHLAGAACQTGAAGVAAWISAADMQWAQASPAVLLDVLGDREPEWLADVTHRLAQRPFAMGSVPYELMAGLVRLSGCPVPTTDAYVQGWMEHIGAVWQRGDTVLDRLRKDPYLRELVAALFEIDGIGSRVEWRYGEGSNSWTYALARLTQEGALDRKVMVDACFARLLRGGAATELRAFLNLLTSLDLTADEQRERAADWLALAAESVVPVASQAQSVLASLALEGTLPPGQLAEMTSCVLFRTEKKLVRAQLILVGKALRRDPSTAAEVVPAVARAFGHEDTDLQERALKLVERHLGGLRAEGALREELADAAARLSPGLRVRAEQLLGGGPSAAAPEAHEEVLPPVPERWRLAPAPQTRAEVVEELGSLLGSRGELSAFERTLDGLVRHAYQDGQGLAEALRPWASRGWWATAAPEDIDRYFRGNSHSLELILATLLGHTRTALLHDIVRRGATGPGCVHSGVADAFHARLREVAYRLRTDPQPFLLSTPSWSTGLLEPEDLVSRLETYRRLDARPGAADFAQALLRLREDDRAGAEAAADRAQRLGTAEGERLARWLTDESPAPPPGRRRTSGVRVLVELGELAQPQHSLPPEFQALGRRVTPFAAHRYCGHRVGGEARHWLGVLPGRRELVAARMLRDLSSLAVEDTRGAAAILPRLAEADGEAGECVHLCLAYGLGARHPEDRLATVDALLVLAARGQLDAGRLGADLGQLVRSGAVKPSRLAEAIRTAAATGARATVWTVLRQTLPMLLADLAAQGAAKEAAKGAAGAPPRGLGDLLAVAAECAERSGAHGDLAHLAQTVGRGGSSKVVTQARRLRDTLTLPTAAAPV